MRISLEKQIKFLEFQIKELEDGFKNYLQKPLSQHFSDKSAFLGNLLGVDEKRSSLIVRFSAGLATRLNMPLQAFAINNFPGAAVPTNWIFSYQKFREDSMAKAGTQLLPTFYLKSESAAWSHIGFTGVDSIFFESAKKAMERGEKPMLLFVEQDPPYQYLLNLKSFIQYNEKDNTLNLDMVKSLDQWHPEFFTSIRTKTAQIVSALSVTDEVIIQGPPGTGKSHLIGDLVCQMVQEGKSVCITSLTNKSLMEVAEKPGISALAKKGKTVFKTNLSADEFRRISGIQRAEKLTIGKGQLLLATYYKLSDWYNSDNSDAQSAIQPIYDLVVIEEASQCFLATIAAFRKLGRKVLIVGDPLQLPPIVLNETGAIAIHPQIMAFARGLESYSPNSDSTSFILTESFRLSKEAVKNTGVFYNNRLQSVQPQIPSLKVGPKFRNLIPENGGYKICFLPMIGDGDQPKNAISMAIDLVLELRSKNQFLQIAILAPFKRTVLSTQEQLGKKTG